jgi:glycogen operon protein
LKHNRANGEDNRDGHNDNQSWNCGVEGPTDDPRIRSLRERQKRNFLCTLMMSQGVPMLLAGDEFGRTQHGNNNAYCQDNEISWIDWNLDETQKELLEFTRRLIAFYHTHPVLRRRKFFQGRKVRGSGAKDITWFRPDGKEVSRDDWKDNNVRCIGLHLAGDAISEVDEQGNPIIDATLLILLNAHHERLPFVLPEHEDEQCWEPIIDTQQASNGGAKLWQGGEKYQLEARSLAILCVKDVAIPRKTAAKRAKVMSRLRLAVSHLLRAPHADNVSASTG